MENPVVSGMFNLKGTLMDSHLFSMFSYMGTLCLKVSIRPYVHYSVLNKT
jgi:hypothetical protein